MIKKMPFLFVTCLLLASLAACNNKAMNANSPDVIIGGDVKGNVIINPPSESEADLPDKESSAAASSSSESSKKQPAESEAPASDPRQITKSESEPNNDIFSANLIEVNSKYTGNLQSDKDVDYYEFTVDSKGKINITFEHDKMDSSNRYWEASILSGLDDSTITRVLSNGNVALSNSDYARISPGTYYLKVNRDYYSNIDYHFTINFFDESDGFEDEPNNNISTANPISTNTKYTGNLQSDKDVDYYKFTLENKGKINLTFEHPKLDSGNRYWYACILDELDDSTLVELRSTGKEALLQSEYARVSPGTYYLKIDRDYYSNEDYNFLVNYVEESDAFETEPNNSFQQANEIALNVPYTGNIQSGRDVDFFRMELEEPMALTLSFQHEKFDSGNRYWEISILNSIDDSTIERIYSRGNEGEVSTRFSVEEPGTYYIKINGDYYSNLDYTFVVSD